MNIEEFNKKITNAIIGKESAEEILSEFNLLKKQEENKIRPIIYTKNKEKFNALLKELKQEIKSIDFSREDLSNLDLDDMVFIECIFEETIFDGSTMDAVEFMDCFMIKASFNKCLLECACFIGCDCKGANFTKAHLMAIYIEESDWSKANVNGANLIEVEAHSWIIDGLVIDKNTAIIEGEFYETDWSKTDVSGLSISLNQVEHFLQCTNGGKYLSVYEDYKLSSMQEKENALFKVLFDDYNNALAGRNVENPEAENSIFFSYASEQEAIIRDFYDSNKGEFNFWMDIELVKEDKLKKQIENELEICKVAIVFLSKEYLIKAWTRYEFFRLIEERKIRSLKIIIINLQKNLDNQILEDFKKEDCTIVENFNELIVCLRSIK